MRRHVVVVVAAAAGPPTPPARRFHRPRGRRPDRVPPHQRRSEHRDVPIPPGRRRRRRDGIPRHHRREAVEAMLTHGVG